MLSELEDVHLLLLSVPVPANPFEDCCPVMEGVCHDAYFGICQWHEISVHECYGGWHRSSSGLAATSHTVRRLSSPIVPRSIELRPRSLAGALVRSSVANAGYWFGWAKRVAIQCESLVCEVRPY